MRWRFTVYAMLVFLLCGSCSPSPELWVRFLVTGLTDEIQFVGVTLKLDSQAHEEEIPIPLQTSEVDVHITSSDSIAGTLSVVMGGLDREHGLLRLGQATQLIEPGISPVTVPITLSPASECKTAPWCQFDQSLTQSVLYGIWGTDAKNVWAVGAQGTILRWNGWSWIPITSPTKETLYRLYGSSNDDIWAVGENATILHYDGKQWEGRKDPDLQRAENIKGVWASAPDDAWAVGEKGSIWRYQNMQWKLKKDNDIKVKLTGIWGKGANDIWIVSQDAIDPADPKKIKMRHYDKAGNWSSVTLPTLPQFTSIWGSDSGSIWVSGYDNLILKYDSRKDSWRSACDLMVGVFFNNVWGSGENVWAVGDKGSIRNSSQVSNCSDPPNQVTAETLYGIWGSNQNDVWAVGASGTILHYRP